MIPCSLPCNSGYILFSWIACQENFSAFLIGTPWSRLANIPRVWHALKLQWFSTLRPVCYSGLKRSSVSHFRVLRTYYYNPIFITTQIFGGPLVTGLTGLRCSAWSWGWGVLTGYQKRSCTLLLQSCSSRFGPDKVTVKPKYNERWGAVLLCVAKYMWTLQ